MRPHHAAWLLNHPHRTAEWLEAMTREGFDIHHLDGDHENNDPDNLVLIEIGDHMRLHGMSVIIPKLLANRMGGLGGRRGSPRTRRRRKPTTCAVMECPGLRSRP